MSGSSSEFRGDDELVCEANDNNNPIDITSTTIELWPPNHKMKAISVAECAEIIACDPEWTAEILWVSSDEPAESGDDDDDCDEDDDDDEDDDEDDDDDDGDDDGESSSSSSTSTGDDGDGDDDGGTSDAGTSDGGTDGDDDAAKDDEDDEDEDEDEEEDEDDNATSSEDIAFVGPDGVELRVERDGNGNGRVYTIAFVIRDSGGNEAESSCTVTVPHDKKGEAIDDGEAYRVEP